MLKELIEKFYNEDGYLKNELRVILTKEEMIEIVKEVADLNLPDKKNKDVMIDEL